MAQSSGTSQISVVIWESIDDKPMEEPLVEVVASRHLLSYKGAIIMPHDEKTYQGKLDSTHCKIYTFM